MGPPTISAGMEKLLLLLGFLQQPHFSPLDPCALVLSLPMEQIRTTLDTLRKNVTTERDPLYRAFAQEAISPLPPVGAVDPNFAPIPLHYDTTKSMLRAFSLRLVEVPRDTPAATDAVRALTELAHDYAPVPSLHAYLVRRLKWVRKLLQIIPTFRAAQIPWWQANDLLSEYSSLSNVMLSQRENIDWEALNPEQRKDKAINKDMEFELATLYAYAPTFEQAVAYSDRNGAIGRRAYGLVFEIYTQAMIRRKGEEKAASFRETANAWYLPNIDAIEGRLREGEQYLLEQLVLVQSLLQHLNLFLK